MVFDKEWFKQNQKTLLYLLNNSVLFRCKLGIKIFDCPNDTKITEITPNSFSFGDKYFKKNGKTWLQRTTDFRSNDKFARRIYYGFLPIWKLSHFFDINVANRFVPFLNLGFDTLTKYPYPADGTANTVDTRIVYTNANWATCHDAATGSSIENTLTSGVISQCEITASVYGISRAGFLFDTSALNIANLVKDSAIFSLYPTGASNNTETTHPADVCIVASTMASNTNPTTADYDQFGTTLLSDTIFDIATFAASGAYNDFPLNAAGLAAVSTTGITKLGTRGQNDVENHTPTARSYVSGVYADGGGTTTGPKLVVTYSLPLSGFFNFF